MEIRLIEPEECVELARVTIAAYEELFGGPLGPYADALADVESRRLDSEVYVALLEGDVVGGVTYVPDPTRSMAEFSDPDAAGIRMLAVDPASQGAGVGRALVDRCLARARECGRARIILHSTTPMTQARAMYERRGFVRTPSLDEIVREDEHTGGVHLMAYVLELS